MTQMSPSAEQSNTPSSPDPVAANASTPDAAPPDATGGSVGGNTIGDRVAKTDTLGFGPYVKAMADFLLHPKTEPPLTVSVEGEWGSGKSSFMELLINEIGRQSGASVGDDGSGETGRLNEPPRLIPRNPARSRTDAKAGNVSKPYIVRFNAWRLEKEEAVWAAFALSFSRQIRERSSWLKRGSASVELFCRRFDWASGWASALHALFLWAALIFLAITLPLLVLLHGPTWADHIAAQLTAQTVSRAAANEKSADAPANARTSTSADLAKSWRPAFSYGLFGAGLMGSLAAAATLWRKAQKLLGNPLEIKLARHLRMPDYEGRTSFIEHFHSDFSRMCKAYLTSHSRVFIFVDDLDRCEVPKAAELMGAIQMLMSEDDRLIFIVGMDREKVAAGVAVKYEALLNYLRPEIAAGANPARRDLDFGYSFLEKFIQLPFAVPRPGAPQLKGFLLDLARSSGAAVQAAAVDTPDSEDREAYYVRLDGDNTLTTAIAIMAAPALDSNVRRIKQFINLFRLKFYLAAQTRLFDRIDDRRSLSPEQLGKITAISLRWPGFIDSWSRHPDLLKQLYEIAMSDRSEDQEDEEEPEERPEYISRWVERQKLMDLFAYGCTEDRAEEVPFDLDAYRMDEIDIEKVLNISRERPNPTKSEGAAQNPQSDSSVTTQTSPLAARVFSPGLGAAAASEEAASETESDEPARRRPRKAPLKRTTKKK